MIQLNEVFFQYKKDQPVLKGINYTFNDGVQYVIQGSNGSGKTTLLRLLCGLLKLTDGNIVHSMNHVIGFLPDNNGLYESMTVIENIKFRISLYKLSYEDLKNDVDDLLTNYDLKTHKNTSIGALSLGMKKKAALICAYIVNPDVLILDEPTGGIDNKSKIELISMLNSVKRNDIITIITSHDTDFIENMKAKNIYLKDGMLKNETAL